MSVVCMSVLVYISLVLSILNTISLYVYLKHFDLTTGRIDEFSCTLAYVFVISVNLNSKGNTFLPSVFFSCKLSTDAVQLQSIHHRRI